MGIRQARIKDIAQRAGVSTGTVDRVLHNRGEVSRSTREKVLEIIQELNYQPNLLASTLASKKKLRIGVIIPEGDPDNPYWQYPIKGIRRAAEELTPYGVSLDIETYLTENTEEFRVKSRTLLAREPDGLLMAPVFLRESQKFFTSCLSAKLPVVCIDTPLDLPGALQFIGQNACQSGHVAGRLLGFGQPLKADFLVFNLYGEKDQLHHFKARARGFSDYIKKKIPQAQVHTHDIANNHKRQIKEVILRMADQSGLPSGILVTGSKTYVAASVLVQMGLENVRLAGYDLVEQNIQYLEDEVIDFLISQQPEEQGYLGIQALYSHLALNQMPAPLKLTPIDIITRENLAYYLNCR